ncbi:MAG: DUF4303 domain-containing protein [Bacteroidota bacterium]
MKSFELKDLLKYSAIEYYRYIENSGAIISFGISTDSDMSSLTFCYNTQEWLNKSLKSTAAYNTKNNDALLPLDIDRWLLNEWKSEIDDYWKEDKYQSLLSKMYSLYKSRNEDNFLEYKIEMFDFFCQVLKELKESQVFNQKKSDFLLLVQQADSPILEQHKESLKKILTKSQWNIYINEIMVD